jgi:hypothetical protein
MDRTGSHWLAIGSIVATSVVTIMMGIATLNGFESSASGDLVVPSAVGSGLNLAILLAGTLVLLSLEVGQVRSRRARHATLARPTGRPSPGPIGGTADPSPLRLCFALSPSGRQSLHPGPK